MNALSHGGGLDFSGSGRTQRLSLVALVQKHHISERPCLAQRAMMCLGSALMRQTQSAGA